MEYKIGICDDEECYLNEIKDIIINYFKSSQNTCSLFLYHSGEGLLQSDLFLDLLFLDIEMGEVSGIDIKNTVSRLPGNCRIIFVSNHEQRINATLGKNVIAFINKAEMKKIEKTLSDVEADDDEHDIIKVGDHLFDMYDIVYMEAQGSYTNVVTFDKQYFCGVTLHALFTRLKGNKFLQVHRSYIINMRYVVDLQKSKIILRNSIEVPISRSYSKIVPLKYFEFMRGCRR